MLCESYREALNDAALTGAQLPAGLKAHLEACASCRDGFSEEKALFKRIAAEVRTRANAEMPVSLLPRVRQEIAAAAATQTWHIPILAYAASGLVVGAIVLSFAMRTRVPPVKPEPSAFVTSSVVTSEPNAPQKESGSGQVFVATNTNSRRPPHVALNAEPEVIVSGEEQIGLQRYAASLRTAKAASAVTKSSTAAEIEPLQIASMDVKQLSIEPLQSSDSD